MCFLDNILSGFSCNLIVFVCSFVCLCWIEEGGLRLKCLLLLLYISSNSEKTLGFGFLTQTVWIVIFLYKYVADDSETFYFTTNTTGACKLVNGDTACRSIFWSLSPSIINNYSNDRSTKAREKF